MMQMVAFRAASSLQLLRRRRTPPIRRRHSDPDADIRPQRRHRTPTPTPTPDADSHPDTSFQRNASVECGSSDQQFCNQHHRLPFAYRNSQRSLHADHDLGNTTTATVSNLISGVTYYFVVTAYNSAGVEGPPSNQASYTAP